MKIPRAPHRWSFREAPALLAALRRLRTEPDVLPCDGHGLAHPRRFGLACAREHRLADRLVAASKRRFDT